MTKTNYNTKTLSKELDEGMLDSVERYADSSNPLKEKPHNLDQIVKLIAETKIHKLQSGISEEQNAAYAELKEKYNERYPSIEEFKEELKRERQEAKEWNTKLFVAKKSEASADIVEQLTDQHIEELSKEYKTFLDTNSKIKKWQNVLTGGESRVGIMHNIGWDNIKAEIQENKQDIKKEYLGKVIKKHFGEEFYNENKNNLQDIMNSPGSDMFIELDKIEKGNDLQKNKLIAEFIDNIEKSPKFKSNPCFESIKNELPLVDKLAHECFSVQKESINRKLKLNPIEGIMSGWVPQATADYQNKDFDYKVASFVNKELKKELDALISQNLRGVKKMHELLDNKRVKLNFKEMSKPFKDLHKEMNELLNNPGIDQLANSHFGKRHVMDNFINDMCKHVGLDSQKDQQIISALRNSKNITLQDFKDSVDNKNFNVFRKLAESQPELKDKINERINNLTLELLKKETKFQSIGDTQEGHTRLLQEAQEIMRKNESHHIQKQKVKTNPKEKGMSLR